MSASITALGTSRSVFSFATNDLEINGDITASKFVGSGDKLTNIRIKSINQSTYNNNEYLLRSLGGTGNNNYIDKGILFNNNDLLKFESSGNFRWDNNENKLLINNKDIVSDYSNYILKTSNVISKNIFDTSNIIISNIITHIQSNIQIINVSGIPKTSTTNYGLVKVGEGLFVNKDGVITINPQDIVIDRPDVEPELTPLTIPDTTYEKFIFKYDPNRGTTFDNNLDGTRSSIIPYWFNFNDNKINNSSNIQSTGYYQTNSLILNNNIDVLIKPLVGEKNEYTPLNNNYLYFNGTNDSYAYLDNSINFYDIYQNIKEIGGSTIGITFSLWFKIDEKVIKNGSIIFLSDNNNLYTLEINIVLDNNNNKIILKIENYIQYTHTINVNIETYKWYHLVWCIGSNGSWKIHLNDANKENILINFKAIIEESSKYTIKNIAKVVKNGIETFLKFSLSDLRIYNRVLTDTEITELYNANIYTEYKLVFNDNNYTKCDILLIGGGGGGTNEAGGGAGELIYINNATIDKKTFNIKIGRGGSGKIINNSGIVIQNNSKGIDTKFGELIINGGGSYNINSGEGGSGSGNGGVSKLNTNFNNFITAQNIYYRGNNGYLTNGGGGGSKTAGNIINGGDGLDSIIDNNISNDFKKIFSLSDNNTEGYYDIKTGLNYFAAGASSAVDNGIGGRGGGGYGSTIFNSSIVYNGFDNTGSGGSGYMNNGFSGGSGIIILRYLNREILNTGIQNDIIETCNFIISIKKSIDTTINNLNTDNINQSTNNNKKFIINNVYDNDLLLNGTLTVNSNLIVLGDSTILNTDIYTTEKIDIINYDSDNALIINQIGGNIGNKNEIFTVLFNYNKLFTIINNGCVGIGIVPQTDANLLEVKGNINIISTDNNNYKFTINNRDIIEETSNFIRETSNLLKVDYDLKFYNTTNYILATSNLLKENLDTASNLLKVDYDLKFYNTTNYILATSNILKENLDTASNLLKVDYDLKFYNTTNYILATSNLLKENLDTASNLLKVDYDLKFYNTTNYILATSNLLKENLDTASNLLKVDYDLKFYNTTNYILATSNLLKENLDTASNLLKVDYDLKFYNTTNYILATSNLLKENLDTASNLLKVDYDLKFYNTTNYILATSNLLKENLDTASNLLKVDYDLKFYNTTNYILATSNLLKENLDTASNLLKVDYDLKFYNTTNYILATSNLLKENLDTASNLLKVDYDLKFYNTTNYILAISNLLKENLDTASNLLKVDYDLKFYNTTNYILATSNILKENLDTASNLLKVDYDLKFYNTTNYILATSNLLKENLDTASNLLKVDYDLKFYNTTNYILDTSNLLKENLDTASNLLKVDYDLKFYNTTNYILATSNLLKENLDTASNLLKVDYDLKFYNTTNYILATSNLLKENLDTASNLLKVDYDLKFYNTTNYILATSNILKENLDTASNLLKVDYDLKFYNTTNYILATSNLLKENLDTASNLLKVDYDLKFYNTTNYILATSNILKENLDTASNLLKVDYDLKFYNTTNYILATSNLLKENLDTASNLLKVDYDLKFYNTTNYILATSNLLKENLDTASNLLKVDYDLKFYNTTNYIIATSNLLKNNLDTASNLLKVDYDLKFYNTTNYILATSNLLKENLDTASNLLKVDYDLKFYNTTNYILATSNLLKENLDTASNLLKVDYDLKFYNTTNYILATSNLLKENLDTASNLLKVDYDLKFYNTTNYILATSNLLKNNLDTASNLLKVDYDLKFYNTTNYILATSNLLKNNLDTASNLLKVDYDLKFYNTTNYILATSNLLKNNLDTASNLLKVDYDLKFYNTTNYIIANCNIISKRISDLNADYIFDGSINRFIINNLYNDDLVINGDLIASNLIVYGEKTILYTDIYTTEQLNIENKGYGSALNIKQVNTYDSIFNASNNTKEVFTILNNGNVGIGTNPNINNLLEICGNVNIVSFLNEDYKFTINNRDIISETSNYILDTSNLLKENLDTASNLLKVDYDLKFYNTTNYILDTSNLLKENLDTASNLLKVDYDLKFYNTTNYILATSNLLKVDYDLKFYNTTNYILATSNLLKENLDIASNLLKVDYDLKFYNTTNYILATSNLLKENLDTTSNLLKVDYDLKFYNTTNYILDTSNLLKENLDTTSNLLKVDYDLKFYNTTNYILDTSNLLSNRISNLTADDIANGTYNKFIVSGIYDGDVEVKGHLITSNITIFGEKTTLITNVFSTEVLEISNNGTDTTINVTQLNQSYDILNAYNNVSNVFTILGNGNVGINEENPSSKLEVKGDIIIDGNILPKISNVSNLGSDSYKWKDLYLSGNSIFLDNLVISKNYNNNLEIKDNQGNYKNININTIELNNSDKKVYISLDTDGNIKYTLNNNQILYPSISSNIDDSKNIITSNILLNHLSNTSNNILEIIRNINTDDIITLDNSENKYIRNNLYNNNLLINGDITINSNLQVNGSNAIINSSLITQNILIENNLLEKALSIKQYSNERILSVSNITSEVFTIINDGKVGINKENPEHTLDIGGNINATAFTRNGQPLSLELSQGMIIQTKHLTYSKTEYKSGNDWQPINNNITNGFVISVKPSDITSKILISMVCHIGMEYLTDSRWWGLRLYRKIGSGSWEHLTDANGIIDNNGYGSGCWISHNLGAESSTYSHFITNVTGSYQDMPNTTETVYYTAYWKNKTSEFNGGSLYLNKSSIMVDNNYPCPSSSWTATEIWNKGTSYIPPPQTSQIQINTQYNTVGIDTSPPTETHKLNVGGNINLINGSYNINGYDILSSTSNYISSTSNYLINKINELIERIQILENT